ncbi:unnamed protein product [Sphagnum troendelagicum]
MSKQASVPELKPDSPSQMLSKHLENFHKTKAKLNFGFRNADNSQVTQPATSTNPFAALEADNPEAEDAMDNPEEMKEGMNNDIEFSGSAHNLLLKSDPVSIDRQACKSETANQLASPQAIRKKRFTKLDLSKLEPQRVVTFPNFKATGTYKPACYFDTSLLEEEKSKAALLQAWAGDSLTPPNDQG